MKILLGGGGEGAELRQLYARALKEAVELYIASAYLTEWDPAWKPGPSCRKLVFVVGRDFGLSRKSAMLTVLKSVPAAKYSFFAADTEEGFHPKLVAWRATSGRHYCIVGSSNLSRAGLSTNYEANAFSLISKVEFGRLCRWVDSMEMIPITEEWISEHYREAPRLGGEKAAAAPVQLSLLPTGNKCAEAVRKRRRRQDAFLEIELEFVGLLAHCALGTMSQYKFWDAFWELYGNRDKPSWRLQGRGFEITAKHAKWRQACRVLLEIIDAGRRLPENQLDRLVASEIDRLAKARNSVRGAWLTEMLCHFFPERYPIVNGPVQKWWSLNKFPFRRGATEGQRYSELAKKLRWVLRKYRPCGAKDLAELDAAIHCCLEEKGLLRKRATKKKPNPS